MNTNLTYKKAGKADIDTIVQLRIEFLYCIHKVIDDAELKLIKDEMISYLNEALDTGDCVFYIAECDGVPAGSGCYALRKRPGGVGNPKGLEAYVMSMYTKDEYRRLGIASDILNLLEAEAGNNNIPMMELHATELGEKVYLKSGYALSQAPNYKKRISIS